MTDLIASKNLLNGMTNLNSRLDSIERNLNKPSELDQAVHDRINIIDGVLENVEMNMEQVMKMQNEQESNNSSIGSMLSDIRKGTKYLGEEGEEEQGEQRKNSTRSVWSVAAGKKAKPLKEIMEEAIRETGKQVTTDAINDTDTEVKLREERSRNIIIYGVKEPNRIKTRAGRKGQNVYQQPMFRNGSRSG
jgi:ribosome-binding ATPase YchF (GTP1/OBG family)